jgi:sugar phosphate isomerase/epimerase
MLYWGCHAVLFREEIKTETSIVLKNLAKTGFSGIEAGFRFIGDDLLPFVEELKKQGLLLAGFHVGTKFSEFLTNPDKVRDFLCHIADKLLEVPETVMPYRNIIMSSSFEGFTGTSFEGKTLEEAAVCLNDIAGQIKEKEVALNYHNHAPEFANGAAIYRVLLNLVPNMRFGFDLGWVEAGGGNVETVLKESKGRVHYVHLRDLAAANSKDFVDLGLGVSDLPKIITLAKEAIGAEGWIVVEYETGERDFNRYLRAREYLRTIGY